MTKTSPPKIKPGSLVSLRYEIFWEGNQCVYSTGNDPVTVKIGESDLLPALEKAIIEFGQPGQLSVTLDPEQGYGFRDEDLLEEVPIESLPVEARVKGARIVATDESGDERDVLVTRVDENKATCLVDFNHPLAGKTLRFEVEILSL